MNQLSINTGQGAFSFVSKDVPALGIADARLGLEVNGTIRWSTHADSVRSGGSPDGVVAAGSGSVLHIRFDREGVEWIVRFALSDDGATASISSTIQNKSSRAARLGKCWLAHAAGAAGKVSLGTAAGETVALVCSGTSGPTTVKRVKSGSNRHKTKTIAQLYNPASGVALQSAFVTLDRVDTEHEVTCSADGGNIGISSFCNFGGFELPAGQSVESERLMLQAGRDPHAQLEAWADAVAAHYRPRLWPKTPAGWVGWSWVDPFNIERYEDVVRRNAAALRRRLPGFDIEYIWVSIGNLKDGYPGNWLEWNSESFPSGAEKLVADLGKLGLKLGLWMGAFWICTALKERVEEMRDALLKRDGKPMRVRAKWAYGAAGPLPDAERPGMFALDPTHPKTHAFLRRVLSTYHRWGVRYYMIDFLHAVSGSTPGDFIYDEWHDRRRIPGPDAYRAGLRVVREAAGADTYLLASSGPTYQNVGLMDACRVGNDYGEGRALNPESYFYPATFVINRSGFWTSHRAAINAMAAGYFTHRKLYIADSGNVLTVDKPIAVSDAQITATIFGLNGGPMMLGDDVDRMAEERLALIRKNLPRLPECARPVDLFDCPEPDHPKLFHLRIARDWDEWHLIAAFNLGDDTLTQPVRLARLGLSAADEFVVWDFWNERHDGRRKGDFNVSVPPRSARLLRIAKRRPHPWLVSTDMHIRQGQAEIESCVWNHAARTLTIRATRPAGQKGNVFILVPPGFEVANPRGLWIAKDGNDNHLIIRCPCEFETATVEKRVIFAPQRGRPTH